MDLERANGVRLRPTQIIVSALCMGVVVFGVVVASLLWPWQQVGWFVTSQDVFEWTAKGLLFVGIVVGTVVWGITRKKARALAAGLTEDQARDTLLPLFQAGTIMRAAMVEGPGLFCIVVALLCHNVWMLAWAGVSVAGLIAIFPTWATYERFLQDAVRRE
ncbi:MAG TPA: hypothetical protein VHN77_06290 [Phycisphaerales bacterium]|nr:hypothetical protein [Phycisphaerales bacterium]